ncbi:MAG: nucleoside recognition domain-containing protein [Clostridium sp.]
MASIVLWFVLNFGIHGYETDVTRSFAAALGRLLVPILRPAGLGTWQIAVALISGLSAKGVVVSSFSVLYGISNINSAMGMAELSRGTGNCRIWNGKCLCAAGVLPAVFPVCGCSGNDPA